MHAAGHLFHPSVQLRQEPEGAPQLVPVPRSRLPPLLHSRRGTRRRDLIDLGQVQVQLRPHCIFLLRLQIVAGVLDPVEVIARNVAGDIDAIEA